MKIVEMKVADLVPYERNPRHNDEAVDYVAESIKQFGFNVPIVIDKDNTVVCGHTRLKAAKKLKIKTVPCVVKDDLTEEEIRAYRLADNRSAEKATWDIELLDMELAEIETIDMGLLGFDENAGGAEPPQDLDDDTEKESIIITLNIKSQVDYEMIKQKVTEIIDGLDVSMAVKMA